MENKIVLTEIDEIEIRKKLIVAASNGKTLFYRELRFQNDSPFMNHLIKVLNKTSLFELSHGRPLLCAIVVSDDKDAEPGFGFKIFCKKHGINPDYKLHQKECFEKWGNAEFRKKNQDI